MKRYLNFNFSNIIGSKIKIVSSFKNKIIKFGDIDYEFQILDDEPIKIQDVNENEREITIPKDESKTVTHSITKMKTIISASKKIEMDGSFNISNFRLNSFNRDEIMVIIMVFRAFLLIIML